MNSSLRILPTLLLMFLFTSLHAQWKNVNTVSVAFKIKNAGITVDGKFRNSSAQVSFDEQAPLSTSFTGLAEVNSISTGIELRDTHLKEKEEFFNASKFPRLQMKSLKVMKNDDGTYTVQWELTMKGISRTFSSVVKAYKSGSNLLVSTTFKLNRLDWKIGSKSLTMGDTVTIILSTLLAK